MEICRFKWAEYFNLSFVIGQSSHRFRLVEVGFQSSSVLSHDLPTTIADRTVAQDPVGFEYGQIQ